MERALQIVELAIRSDNPLAFLDLLCFFDSKFSLQVAADLDRGEFGGEKVNGFLRAVASHFVAAAYKVKFNKLYGFDVTHGVSFLKRSRMCVWFRCPALKGLGGKRSLQ